MIRLLKTNYDIVNDAIAGKKKISFVYNTCVADSFAYKRKEIVDSQISMEVRRDGAPWPAYGRDKMALFIEEMIMRKGGSELC